jgi:hypothetical protein
MPVRKAVFEISSISTSSGTQTRLAISEATVAEYAEAMIVGDRFPPVVVFRDGDKVILADGFHRVRAARQAGFEKITAEVHVGSRLDALLYSLGSNDKHGLRRTNEDKRYAVTVALREFAHLSDRMIAGMCGVSVTFAGSVRRQLSTMDSSQKRLGKDGKARKLPTKAPTLLCGTDATPKPLPVESTNVLERKASKTALDIAERFSALEVDLKAALNRFPAKRSVFLAVMRKIRTDLTLLENKIRSGKSQE